MAAAISVVVAWLVNSLISMMSGERPDDLRHDALDIFLRVLGGWELGVFGRILIALGENQWVRRILYLASVVYLIQVACTYWIHH